MEFIKTLIILEKWIFSRIGFRIKFKWKIFRMQNNSKMVIMIKKCSSNEIYRFQIKIKMETLYLIKKRKEPNFLKNLWIYFLLRIQIHQAETRTQIQLTQAIWNKKESINFGIKLENTWKKLDWKQGNRNTWKRSFWIM
jgi:predicted nucleic-acid-binding Zn-ribbon protein